MNLESQVVSLDLSKRLKELGVEQQSLFQWAEDESIIEFIEGERKVKETETKIVMLPYYDISRSINWWSAFTVAELGNLIPKQIDGKGKIGAGKFPFYYTQIPGQNKKDWIIFYRNTFMSLPQTEVCDEKEADCRAKMLIYLLENRIIKNNG